MATNKLIRTITVLPVNNIARACDWYEKALGMKTDYLHEGQEEGEETNYAIVVRDGVDIHLILDEPPPYDAPWTKAGTGYLFLKVSDIDVMFREVESSGVEITRGLQTENWGARAFNLTDPSGNAIHVEQE